MLGALDLSSGRLRWQPQADMRLTQDEPVEAAKPRSRSVRDHEVASAALQERTSPRCWRARPA